MFLCETIRQTVNDELVFVSWFKQMTRGRKSVIKSWSLDRRCSIWSDKACQETHMGTGWRYLREKCSSVNVNYKNNLSFKLQTDPEKTKCALYHLHPLTPPTQFERNWAVIRVDSGSSFSGSVSERHTYWHTDMCVCVSAWFLGIVCILWSCSFSQDQHKHQELCRLPPDSHQSFVPDVNFTSVESQLRHPPTRAYSALL